MYKTPHSRRIDLSTRHDHHTHCPMERIRPNGIGTSLPSNYHASFLRFLANIFRSIHRSYRRIPLEQKSIRWEKFAALIDLLLITFSPLHSAECSTQAPYEQRNLSSRHWKEMHSITVSSLPSLQSTFPLHRSLMPMHSPLPQTHDKIASQLLFCAKIERWNRKKTVQNTINDFLRTKDDKMCTKLAATRALFRLTTSQKPVRFNWYAKQQNK